MQESTETHATALYKVFDNMIVIPSREDVEGPRQFHFVTQLTLRVRIASARSFTSFRTTARLLPRVPDRTPTMSATLTPPLPPMEAKSVDEIPVGPGWQYEPKWDGFRCLAFRRGKDIYLQSKSGQPLARYFPEIVVALSQLAAKKFALDGELVIDVGGRFSFDELQLRLHPAASRVQKLAATHPATFIVFDLLESDAGKSLLNVPLRERRMALEKFASKNLKSAAAVRLSPETTSLAQAKKWFDKAGGNLDGIIAKRLDAVYTSGERTAVVKVKNIRTADCVVGGFRYASGSKLIGSLLLGLYDDAGFLHHVGFTSDFKTTDKRTST